MLLSFFCYFFLNIEMVRVQTKTKVYFNESINSWASEEMRTGYLN